MRELLSELQAKEKKVSVFLSGIPGNEQHFHEISIQSISDSLVAFTDCKGNTKGNTIVVRLDAIAAVRYR